MNNNGFLRIAKYFFNEVVPDAWVDKQCCEPKAGRNAFRSTHPLFPCRGPRALFKDIGLLVPGHASLCPNATRIALGYKYTHVITFCSLLVFQVTRLYSSKAICTSLATNPFDIPT